MSRADLPCYAAAVFSVSVGIGLICCGVMEDPQHWGRLTDAPLPRIETFAQRPAAEQAGALSASAVPPRPDPASRFLGPDWRERFHPVRYGSSDDQGALPLPTLVVGPLAAVGPTTATDERDSGAAPLAEAPPPPKAPAPAVALAAAPLPPRSPPRATQTAARAKATPRQRIAAQDPSPADMILPSTGSGTPAKNAGINEFNSRNGGSAPRASGASSDNSPRSDGSRGLLSWIFGGDDRPAASVKPKHKARAKFASVEPTDQAAPDR